MLSNRCATCLHWNGDRKKVEEELNKAENKERFLNMHHTWSVMGECRDIGWALDVVDAHNNRSPETDGVFGCILHEPCESI
jgi:hypothetical protein